MCDRPAFRPLKAGPGDDWHPYVALETVHLVCANRFEGYYEFGAARLPAESSGTWTFAGEVRSERLNLRAAGLPAYLAV